MITEVPKKMLDLDEALGFYMFPQKGAELRFYNKDYLPYLYDWDRRVFN